MQASWEDAWGYDCPYALPIVGFYVEVFFFCDHDQGYLVASLNQLASHHMAARICA